MQYDAENRLIEVKKNGVVIATFTHDGDGKQVKSVVNGVTTYLVGAHYHVENGQVTKYYFAGAQRVAIRKNGTLSYMLSDHLGSTLGITNTSGTLTAGTLYKAWGETRYTLGTVPTKFKYTGQREESAFGLYFYNARWYDPAVGRFTSADTVVPPNIQGLDRYSYVNNSPLNYIDPSGHQCERGLLAHEECDNVNEWGVSDQELSDILSLAKMGDVIAYDLKGTTNYAVFALNENGALVLWDMTSRQTISAYDIQSQIIGYFPFDEEESNFDLYLGIGNTSGATDLLGSTIHFTDFPVDWKSGPDAHIQFTLRDEFNCDAVCAVIGIGSGGTLTWEVGLYLAGAGGNPFVLAFSVAAFGYDIFSNIEPGDPLVVVYPEPLQQPSQPIPTFEFPDPFAAP